MWPWDYFNIINAKLDNITALLRQLIKEEYKAMVDLTSLTAEVTNNTNVTQSVITLVNNLAAQIAALETTDPNTQKQIDALVATLNQNDTAIGNAVAANTVAGPPAPAPAPAPTPAPTQPPTT